MFEKRFTYEKKTFAITAQATTARMLVELEKQGLVGRHCLTVQFWHSFMICSFRQNRQAESGCCSHLFSQAADFVRNFCVHVTKPAGRG